ncbi:hypothetical protein SO802_015254 [Lithocarpus litseifolius]|uniref:Uncharacterized protein n=1 Tax=Lithocarpus litseifolius TaxID=425828 RepID=A0AAW2CT64_9ROSI
MASFVRCPKKAICNESAKRICVKAHYLFNESLRSFLGCGDDENSSLERRPKFVDLKPIKGVDVDLCYIYKLLMGVADLDFTDLEFERAMRVESAGSLLGRRPLTSQLCQRLWWWSVAPIKVGGCGLVEMCWSFISFRK